MKHISLPGRFFSVYVLTGSVLICLLLLASCDNTVDPLDEERGIYSIYGALNMNSDVNYIRVRDLNVPIRDGEIVDFNGTVKLENLVTSETQILSDTLVQFDGVYVRNFITTMSIEPETTYEISAENPEGRRVSATASTPNFAEAEVLTEFPDCTTTVDLQIAPLNSGQIQIELGFRWLGQIRWVTQIPGHTFKTTSQTDPAFNIQFTLKSLIQNALSDGDIWCHHLPEDEFYYRYTHFGPDFFLDTISDTLNIPGGSGNFGAFYNDDGSFRVDTSNVCAPFCPD